MAERPPDVDTAKRYPAGALGLRLPPGYHLLRVPLQIILGFGEAEVRRFTLGTKPKEIEDHAQEDFIQRQWAWSQDGITGLPWSMALRKVADRRLLDQDLHAVCVHLEGLSTLMDLYGYRSPISVLQHAARRLKRLGSVRDTVTRHSGDRFMILTTRSKDEIKSLTDEISQDLSSMALEIRGKPTPHVRIGVAGVTRTEDRKEVEALVEALLFSAETALEAAEVPQTSPSRRPRKEDTQAGTVEASTVEASVTHESAGTDHAEVAAVAEKQPTPQHPVEPAAESKGRIVLNRVVIDLVGNVATAVVEIAHHNQTVAAKVVGPRSVEAHHRLIAEATAHALTTLLPSGYGVQIQAIQPTRNELGDALLTRVRLITPTAEETLLGSVPVNGDEYQAAARTVLNAINRRIGPILDP